MGLPQQFWLFLPPPLPLSPSLSFLRSSLSFVLVGVMKGASLVIKVKPLVGLRMAKGTEGRDSGGGTEKQGSTEAPGPSGWAQVSVPALLSCVTLGNWLNFSRSQFSFL